MAHTRQIARMINEATKAAKIKAAQLQRTGAIGAMTPHYCKAIVCAALTDTAARYRPLSAEGKADLKNLEHF